MIVLTDTASSKVAELLAQEGDEGLVLRVGVRPGGCAGMNYEMGDMGIVQGNDTNNYEEQK